MTREERLAAGWMERWAVRYSKPALWIKNADYTVGGPKGFRKLFNSYDEAWGTAHGIVYPPIAVVRVWRRKKPRTQPPLKVEEFTVKQCDLLGRRTECGGCRELWTNHWVSSELRHKGRVVGHVGAMFNVDEKCRVVRMSIIPQWIEDR